MKQVKQLCLVQLKLMSSDKLRRIILDERQVEPVETVQDKDALQLTEDVKGESGEEEEEKYEGEGEESAHSSSSGSNTVTDKQGIDSPLAGMQPDKPSSLEVKYCEGVDSRPGQQEWLCRSDLAKRRRRAHSEDEKRPREHPENDGVLVSDISDGEGEETASNEQQMKEATSADDSEVCRVGSYAEDCIDIGTGPNQSHIDRELVDGRRNSRVETKENRRKEAKNSNSEDECSEESSWEREVPEGARIMEIELRKRALEAALRHSMTASLQLKSTKQTCVPNTELTTISEQGSLSTHGTAPDQSEPSSLADSTSGRGSQLEIQLRERALQSMLTKKAQAKSQCM